MGWVIINSSERGRGQLLICLCGVQVTCLACSPANKVAAVGDRLGFVYVIDLSDLHNCRVVSAQRLSQTPIEYLR